MADAKMVSEREAILRERAAVNEALRVLCQRGGERFLGALPQDWEGSLTFAAKLHPLPQVERPRVVPDGQGLAWRMVCGLLEFRWEQEPRDRNWYKATENVVEITHPRIRLWADLLANPTELVSDSGDTA
jgi:hypothetical protein